MPQPCCRVSPTFHPETPDKHRQEINSGYHSWEASLYLHSSTLRTKISAYPQGRECSSPCHPGGSRHSIHHFKQNDALGKQKMGRFGLGALTNLMLRGQGMARPNHSWAFENFSSANRRECLGKCSSRAAQGGSTTVEVPNWRALSQWGRRLSWHQIPLESSG